jgi:hypothetical protein
MSGCWLWTASVDQKGYGQFAMKPAHKRPLKAHRVAWEIYRGQVPDELCVLHKCDQPACVNPDHLWLGTVADNNHDMFEKGRSAPPRVAGEAHGRAKLTLEDVEAIRADKRHQRTIARDYGVSKSQIGNIKRAENWR